MISQDDIDAMREPDITDGWRESKKLWYGWMTKAGHTPILTRGEDNDEKPTLDIWVLEQGFHNGPGCSTCGASWCMHCVHGEIQPCKGKK